MAYVIRSQKFLCCLPVRIGVFVLSFLQFLSSAFVAFIFWFAIFQKNVNLDHAQRVSAIILGVFMTILAIVSLCGFMGSIFRRHGLVELYSSTLNWLLGFSIGLGIFWAVELFKTDKQKLISDCVDGRTDQDIINACNHVTTIRFVALGVLIFGWLVHLYECIIVARYVEQLREEKDEKWRLRSLKTQSAYSEVPGRGSTEALTHPVVVGYPYADASHSYGGGPSNV